MSENKQNPKATLRTLAQIGLTIMTDKAVTDTLWIPGTQDTVVEEIVARLAEAGFDPEGYLEYDDYFTEVLKALDAN